MSLFECPLSEDWIRKGLELADRVEPKYAPVFLSRDRRDAERAALALYFLPHGSAKESLGVARPRVLKWYGPFADQRVFPSGHRYSLNIYTGCEHRCVYCYVNGYIASDAASAPRRKIEFRKNLLHDLDELDRFDVPAAPLHLSNSTDAFQPLESEYGDALFALEQAARRRGRFSCITLLTKNPGCLVKPKYADVLHRLNRLPAGHPRAAAIAASGRPPLCLEVSLAFFDDSMREIFDPEAPAATERIAAIRTLREQGIPLILRIDPLFPRDPLPGGRSMRDFGLPNPQPLEDIERLVAFAAEVGVEAVVYSVVKLTRPRTGTVSEPMRKLLELARFLSEGGKTEFHGGSWRWPRDYAAEQIVAPLLELCGRYGLPARFCMENLLATV